MNEHGQQTKPDHEEREEGAQERSHQPREATWGQEAKRPRGQKGLLGQIALVIYRRTAEGREAQPLGWRIQGRGWVQQPGGPFNE